MKGKVKSSAPNLTLVTSWITGKTDLKYTARFDGPNTKEMVNSAKAHIEFGVHNGSSRALMVDGAKPLKFRSLQGALQLEKQTLKVLPCKLRAENGIYDLSGTVSLADKRAKLRLSNKRTHWDITGTLEEPQIAGRQPAARTTASRSR